jgi:hypothetical protein
LSNDLVVTTSLKIIVTCRWDERAVAILPDYLQTFYTKLLATFEEFEDCLGADEKYRVTYAIAMVGRMHN